MTRRIFRSIFLVAAAVLLASLVIIMGCLYEYFGSVQENQMKDQLELAAAAVEDGGADYLDKLGSDNYRLTWIAPDGTVICDTLTDAETMENHSDRVEIWEALTGGEGESSRYSSTLLQKTLYRAQRLADGSVLRISVSRATEGLLTLGMLQPILTVLVIALALSGFLAARMSRRIAEPLNRIDLESPLENGAYEELSPLLDRLKQQHNEINAQMRLLKRQRDEFAQITDSIKEGLVLLDANGAVLSINSAAQRLFGTDRSIVGGSLLTASHSAEMSAAMGQARDSGAGELRLEQSGRVYQLELSGIKSDGETVGTVILSFDITEQEAAEQSRREFTANVSHELKTPLQGIIGSAELLEKGMVKQEDAPRFIGHIRTEAARLVALIEDIIRLSQLDEGQEMPHENVDMLELAREAADNLHDAAVKKGVTLTVTGDGGELCGVRPLLYEVIYNLSDNAVKYNKDNGSAEINVSSDARCVFVTVKDSGIGIPPEYRSRVFERFYRVDKSHSRSSGGTGLGLSIVKHAVQYHRGHIELQSEPGRGTEIKVTLPKPAE